MFGFDLLRFDWRYSVSGVFSLLLKLSPKLSHEDGRVCGDINIRERLMKATSEVVYYSEICLLTIPASNLSVLYLQKQLI